MEQEQQRDTEAANEALRVAYVRWWGGVAGKHDLNLVLDDLARFCRAHETTWPDSDPYLAARLNGRREVWMRIQNFVNLDMPALLRAYWRQQT